MSTNIFVAFNDLIDYISDIVFEKHPVTEYEFGRKHIRFMSKEEISNLMNNKGDKK